MRTCLIAMLALISFNQADTFTFPPMCHIDRNQMNVLVKQREMVDTIALKYKIDAKLAKNVVKLAHKYESRVFPRAKDIVAIIGIESAFRPTATSALKKDPAFGLMQVRPKAWSHKFKPDQLNDIDGQIKAGADILAHYYQVLDGDKQGTIGAYNVGLRNYVQGKKPDAVQRYVDKYSREVVAYK